MIAILGSDARGPALVISPDVDETKVLMEALQQYIDNHDGEETPAAQLAQTMLDKVESIMIPLMERGGSRT